MNRAARWRASVHLLGLLGLLGAAACSEAHSDVADMASGAHPDGGAPDLSTGGAPDLGPGGSSDMGPPPDGASDMATQPGGTPITAPAGTWTWVDFPGTSCDDGSPTGIGVNPGKGANLLLFFNGGGACCDYNTCYVQNLATHGPYGATQFKAGTLAFVASIFNRGDAKNPYKDWSYVFIPYCTGDLHAGDNVITYSSGGQSKVYHHAGHTNVAEFMQRIAATWPAPPKLVVSGSSAGGYGSLLNYAYIRGLYPAAQSDLIDDSGPPLTIPNSGVGACIANWKADLLVDPLCQGCVTDPGRIPPVLASRYPQDRLALLSSEQDEVIRGFLGLTGAQFQAELDSYAQKTLAPLANFKYFFASGKSHTMLFDPGFYTTQGTSLPTWLQQMVSGDASWKSLTP